MVPKHPEIRVRLSDQDGNAFLLLGICVRAAKDAGLAKQQFGAFLDEARGIINIC